MFIVEPEAMMATTREENSSLQDQYNYLQLHDNLILLPSFAPILGIRKQARGFMGNRFVLCLKILSRNACEYELCLYTETCALADILLPKAAFKGNTVIVGSRFWR